MVIKGYLWIHLDASIAVSSSLEFLFFFSIAENSNVVMAGMAGTGNLAFLAAVRESNPARPAQIVPPQKEKQRKRKKFSKAKGRQRRQVVVVWAGQFLGRPLDSSGIINTSRSW